MARALQQNIVATGTNFAIAGYRYSTSGYYGLQEVLDTYRSGNRYALTDRRKTAPRLRSTRIYGRAGSLSLSAVSEDYWNSERNMQSLSAGYNNSWNGISYGFNYSYNRNSQAIYGDSDRGQRRIYDRDQLFAFNISVPLEKWLSNTYATYSLNTSQRAIPAIRRGSTARRWPATTSTGAYRKGMAIRARATAAMPTSTGAPPTANSSRDTLTIAANSASTMA